MVEQTPNTKLSALDKVNVRRMVNYIKQTLAKRIEEPDPEYGTALPELFQDNPDEEIVRAQMKTAFGDFFDTLVKRGALNDYEIGKMRRQLWRDIYPDRASRKVAVTATRRMRLAKERRTWREGDHLTDAQIAEFGHLLHWDLYGVNDWLTGAVSLRSPAGVIIDLMIKPVQPVNYIILNMEITK